MTEEIDSFVILHWRGLRIEGDYSYVPACDDAPEDETFEIDGMYVERADESAGDPLPDWLEEYVIDRHMDVLTKEARDAAGDV